MHQTRSKLKQCTSNLIAKVESMGLLTPERTRHMNQSADRQGVARMTHVCATLTLYRDACAHTGILPVQITKKEEDAMTSY